MKGAISKPLLAALTIGLLARLFFWSIQPQDRFASDEDGYYRAGIQLVESGRQDHFWPPVTGWLIGAAALILGSSRPSSLRLFWIGMDLVNLVLLHRLAARSLDSRLRSAGSGNGLRPSSLAGAAYALYLPAIGFSVFTTSETPAVTLLLTCCLLLLSVGLVPRHLYLKTAAAGLVSGLLVLTRLNLALLPAAFGTLLGFEHRRRARPNWYLPALLYISMAAILPSMVLLRNWTTTGIPMVAINSAYNLYIGNQATYSEDLDLFSPSATPEQIRIRREYLQGTFQPPPGLSPVEMQRQAIHNILDRPLLFLRRALGRLARLFVPKTAELALLGGESRTGVFSVTGMILLILTNAEYASLLVTGLLGLFIIAGYNDTLQRLILATLLGGLPLCLVAIAKPRYSFPFEPLLLLGAAATLSSTPDTLVRTLKRHLPALMAAASFFAWSWIAWLIFAFTSRLALR